MTSLEQALYTVVKVLTTRQIPYAVMGGLAVGGALPPLLIEVARTDYVVFQSFS